MMPRLHHIAILPALKFASDLDALQPVLDWYLAGYENLNVHIWCDETIVPETNVENLTIHSLDDRVQSNTIDQAKIVLFWDIEAFWQYPAHIRRKSLSIDRYATPSWEDYLCIRLAELYPHSPKTSKELFVSWQAQLNKSGLESAEALIIGPGPTGLTDCETIPESKDSWNIYLSSAIHDDSLKAIRPPHVIVAADGAAQFSYSVAAREFQENLWNTMRLYDSKLLYPNIFTHLVCLHWPEDIQDQCLAVPLSGPISLPYRLTDLWASETTGNVLSGFALPCAYTLSSQISFAGITLPEDNVDDGANNAVWKHRRENRNLAHSAQLLKEFPLSGWFSDDYGARHFKHLSTWISSLLNAGVILKRRGVPVEISPQKKSPKSSWKPKAYRALLTAEHYPFASMLILCVLGVISVSIVSNLISKDLISILLGGLILVLGFALYLYVKTRMSRLYSKLERQQTILQTRQFENLSERLEILTRRVDAFEGNLRQSEE